MTLAFLDCFSGVAGDMWVGALLDLGLPIEDLRPAVDSLDLPGVEIDSQRVMRGSLGGEHFQVRVADGAKPHRHLADILAILERAELPPVVAARAQAVFQAIGTVEAQVHGVPIEDVHFHEVGAEDTIVDIVCAVLGCHLMGIDEIYSSAVVTGRGTVQCDHGDMPVPAPGALGNLLGVPLRSGGPEGECVTPTGAALLKVLVDGFEPDLRWVPERIGYGAGTRDDPSHPNLLRITLGRRQDAEITTSTLTELKCNLDTITGEGLAYLVDGAMRSGAVDAFAHAIQMKKGRPGWLFTALAADAKADAVAQFLLEESTTLGIRRTRVDRDVLERWTETIQTTFGPVQFKIARLPSGEELCRPEEDEVRRLADSQGIGRRAVLARLQEIRRDQS
jgi:uncharacterized protein (TIGR00299 family) protein